MRISLLFGPRAGRSRAGLAARLLGLALAVLAGLPARAQLTITSRTPPRHAPAVAANSSVSFTFSQAPTAAAAANIHVLADQSGRRTVTLSTAGATVTLDPATDFRPGEVVSVTVPATVQTAGGAAAAPQVHQFRVGATGGARHFAFWQQLDTLSTSAQRVDVRPADVNGDGLLDLVSISSTTMLAGALTVNLGLGAGLYGPALTQPLFDGPSTLAVGDVDGDGDPDVLVAGAGSAAAPNPCLLLRNNGTGTFGNPLVVPTPSRLRTLTLGDLDADGDLDLVGGPDQTGSTAVLFNDGTGAFSLGSTIFALGDAATQHLADVDNDGDLDLLHVTVPGTTRLAFNTGSGTFASPFTALPFRLGLPPADLNGDGNLDLVARLLSPAGMQVHLGTGTGTFTARPATSFVGGGNQAGLRLALLDADGDADLDVVAAFVQSPARFIVARNNGSGAFTASAATAMPLPTAFVLSIIPADLDGDGDLDLLAPTSAQAALLLLRNAAPVGLTEDEADAALRLYPNPARGRATLTWPAAAPGPRPAEAVLLDGVGRLVRRWPLGAETTELDLRGLSPGLYLLRAAERTARFVVE